MTTYLLRPRPPLRAFLISAVLALVGAALLVLSLSRSWPIAVTAVAAAIVVIALVLLGLALASRRTLAMRVTFDDEGYRAVGPDVDLTGSWSDITKVVQTDDGARVVFHHGEVRRTHLWCPGGADDPQMQALVADVAKRLDHSNGYRKMA